MSVIGSNLQEVFSRWVQETPSIDQNFTQKLSISEQRLSHEEAKNFLSKTLNTLRSDYAWGVLPEVAFISPPPLAHVTSLEDVLIETLDPEVFAWQRTQGVGTDIQADGERPEDNIVMYGVASQFNGAESPGRYTVPPGQACATYAGDRTQGPEAQLQFPKEQVELINCAANRGLNGLCYLLTELARGAVQHGYLTPQNETEMNDVIQLMKTRGHLIDYLCIGNTPSLKTKKVYQILTAAPAFGDYRIMERKQGVKAKENELAFLCALHAYRAQFAHAVKLAQETGKPVILKAIPMGLGVFGNSYVPVATAFYSAGKEFESRLKASGVKVDLQLFNAGYSRVGHVKTAARDMMELLQLTEKTAAPEEESSSVKTTPPEKESSSVSILQMSAIFAVAALALFIFFRMKGFPSLQKRLH